MKKLSFVIILILIAFALAIIQTGCAKIPNTEELKTYFEVIDMKTKWVEKYYQPWPPKLKLVPSISFRVKNLTDKPLRYVYFNAVFKQKGDVENLGDDLKAAIGKKPLMPGEVSDVIFMKSNFGVEGKLLSDFKNNLGWKTCMVNLFIKLKGSRYALLGEWEISREIDFKEPEPVGPRKKEKGLSSD